jgi:hypothetical protein
MKTATIRQKQGLAARAVEYRGTFFGRTMGG